MSATNGWIGVDLDGTLAHYAKWEGPGVVGAPIPAMVDRVRSMLAEGKEVRIFTARVSSSATPADRDAAVVAITKFCMDNFGRALPITSEKDFAMVALFDDRCQTVEANTGKILSVPPDGKTPDFSNPDAFNVWLDDVENTLKAVRARRCAQLQQGCHTHDIPTWIAHIGESFGHLSSAYLDTKLSGTTDPAGLIHEATDVAANASALLQYLEKGHA